MTPAAAAVRLKTLAYRVRDADPHRRVFCSGDGGYGYVFHDQLDEHEIADFEKSQKIQLPADYRGFLLHAGNGGAGPGYGVTRMRRWKGHNLKAPFSAEVRPDPDTNIPGERGDVYSGCIQLCQHGCGHDDYLVVNGPRHGTVWGTGDTNYASFVGDSFATWYEAWADRVLPLLARDELLDRVRPGQPLAELVRVFGRVQRTWGENPGRGERYVSFANLSASVRLDRGDAVAEVIRLGIE